MTLRIISTAVLTFVAYFTIGLQIAAIPTFVHLDLGFSAILAGLAVSVQYVATLVSRPVAGRMGDSAGARRTTCIGLLISTISGLTLMVSASLPAYAFASLGVLLASRLLLGVGESLVATGATIWGIGRTGAAQTGLVISWNGIASFGALAIGAPCGVWIAQHGGVGAIGLVSTIVAAAGFAWAWRLAETPVVSGERVGFRRVLGAVLPYGVSLALGGIGFGTIAAFITLYYESRGWSHAGLSLSLFGAMFVAARLLLADTINTWGGYRVAIVSLAGQSVGLLVFALADGTTVALIGIALAGFGNSLVFPSLGVEAVRHVPLPNRGAALGVYTAFIDLSLGISGPLAGAIVSLMGYRPIFFVAAGAALIGMVLPLVLYYQQARVAPRRAGAGQVSSATSA